MDKFKVKPMSLKPKIKPKGASNHRNIHIDDFPDAVLRKIFENLSVRDLFSSTLVCHRWHLLASDDLLWQKICWKQFPNQIKELPLVGAKKFILMNGHKKVQNTIDKVSTTMKKKLLFPADISLKSLRISICLEITNHKNDIIFTWGKLIPEIWTLDNLSFEIPLTKLSSGGFTCEDIHSISLYALVPHFPESFLTWKESPRSKLCIWKCNSLHFKSSDECKTHQMSCVHVCQENMIYAVWNDIAEMGYLFISLLPAVLLRSLRNMGKQQAEKISATTNKKRQVCQKLEPKSKIPPVLTDYRCCVTMSDFKGNRIFFSTWRSFDFYEEKPCKTKGDSESLAQWIKSDLILLNHRSSHALFDDTPCLFINLNHFKESIQNAFLVKALVEDSSREKGAELCKACICEPCSVKNDVNYDYDGDYYRFNVTNRKCRLMGTMVHVPVDKKFTMIQLSIAMEISNP